MIRPGGTHGQCYSSASTAYSDDHKVLKIVGWDISTDEEAAVENSVATVEAIGKALEAMDERLASQQRIIDICQAEIRDLKMHKEAAYAEMLRAEVEAKTQLQRAQVLEAENNRLGQSLFSLQNSENTSRDQLEILRIAIKTTLTKASGVALEIA